METKEEMRMLRPRDAKFGLLAMLFVTCFIVANITAFKRVEVLGLVFPSAVFAFLLAFVITDVTAEVYGGRTARELIVGGFIANMAAVILIQLAIALPAAGFWVHQDAFSLVLGYGLRITAAGMVTFVVSKNINIWIFEKIRAKTGKRHLWLRNNGSSFVAQLIDTAMFQLLAFAGDMPWGALWAMILTSFVVKMVLDLAKTPLVYLGVWYCDRGTENVP